MNIWPFPPRNARTADSWADLGIANIDVDLLRANDISQCYLDGGCGSDARQL